MSKFALSYFKSFRCLQEARKNASNYGLTWRRVWKYWTKSVFLNDKHLHNVALCTLEKKIISIYITSLGYKAHDYTCPKMFKNACCGSQDIIWRCLKLHSINVCWKRQNWSHFTIPFIYCILPIGGIHVCKNNNIRFELMYMI